MLSLKDPLEEGGSIYYSKLLTPAFPNQKTVVVVFSAQTFCIADYPSTDFPSHVWIASNQFMGGYIVNDP